MAAKNMTDVWLRTLRIEKGREEYSDVFVRGLRLRASPQSKKWSILTRKEGKQRRFLIGEYPSVGLLEARTRANEILAAQSAPELAIAKSIAVESRAPSVEQLCLDYTRRMQRRGQKSYNEYKRVLVNSDDSFVRFMNGQLGRVALVGDVQAEHVTAWLREKYERAPSQARHGRAYLHAVFEWAIKSEFDYTSPVDRHGYGVATNPVAPTPVGVKSEPRQRVLSYAELKCLWEVAPQVADPQTATAIRLIIAMGGLRITEILHSKLLWYADGWLALPETKNGRRHSLPLTELAKQQFEIAKAIRIPASDYLFPHAFDSDKPMLLSSIGKIPSRIVKEYDLEPFQLRDIRRTMKTQLLDREYVEGREIDIWHNHGQKTDVARKHYSWAEFKTLKLRVAEQIDTFLHSVLQ